MGARATKNRREIVGEKFALLFFLFKLFLHEILHKMLSLKVTIIMHIDTLLN